MASTSTAVSIQAIQAVEGLIEAYRLYSAEGFYPGQDGPFRRYLTEVVAPTMSAAERARYEGYLRRYYQERLEQPAENAPKLRPPATVAESTEIRYEQRARRLIEDFEAETGQPFDPDEPDFAEYMAARFERLSRASRRAYQAALNHHYQHALKRSEGAPDFREGMNPSAAEPRPKKRQSAPKGIPPAHQRALVNELARRTTFHPRLAGLTLESSVRFGLRPREWIDAELITVADPDSGRHSDALRVQNAKHSHKRAHSATRTLIIDRDEATEALLARTAETINVWRAYVERFAADHGEQPNSADREQAIRVILSVAGQSLRRATQRLGLPAYTLYSARHQFAANAKAAGLDQVEVAALMGHASPETAGEHYGKRRSGSKGGFIVRPAEADIAAVEARVRATVQDRLAHIEPSPDNTDQPSL